MARALAKLSKFDLSFLEAAAFHFLFAGDLGCSLIQRGLRQLPMSFLRGFLLTISIVSYTPKPFSNHEGPYIRFLQVLRIKDPEQVTGVE